LNALKNIQKYDFEEMGNPYGFWREYMNKVIPENEKSIKPEDIKYWS